MGPLARCFDGAHASNRPRAIVSSDVRIAGGQGAVRASVTNVVVRALRSVGSSTPPRALARKTRARQRFAPRQFLLLASSVVERPPDELRTSASRRRARATTVRQESASAGRGPRRRARRVTSTRFEDTRRHFRRAGAASSTSTGGRPPCERIVVATGFATPTMRRSPL